MDAKLELDEKTMDELRLLRAEMDAKSFDEVLDKLIAMHRKGARPVKGITSGIGPYTRE